MPDLLEVSIIKGVSPTFNQTTYNLSLPELHTMDWHLTVHYYVSLIMC